MTQQIDFAVWISAFSLLISTVLAIKEIVRACKERKERTLRLNIPFSRMIAYSIKDDIRCNMDMMIENQSSLPVSLTGMSLLGEDGSDYDADVFPRTVLRITNGKSGKSGIIKSSDLPLSIPSHQTARANIVFDLHRKSLPLLRLHDVEPLEGALNRLEGQIRQQAYTRSWRSLPRWNYEIALRTSRGPVRMKAVAFRRPLVDALVELQRISKLPDCVP